MVPVLSALVTAIITPIILHYLTKKDQKDAIQEMSCEFDNAAIRFQLQSHLMNDMIPYYGNSDDGNVKPQMIVYIDAYGISSNPNIKQAILTLKSEVEKRSTNPEYFKLDNDFRAKMDVFKNKMSLYVNSCVWQD